MWEMLRSSTTMSASVIRIVSFLAIDDGLG
jgi:hypothetical protein